MAQQEKLLKDYTETEKAAYLTAIASIASADRSATEEELEFLDALADAAELSPAGKELLREASVEITGDDLKQSLDVLKGSELRFSLLADLVAFAEADQDYSADEKNHITRVANYLNITQEQQSTINQFVQKASQTDVPEEQRQQPQNFFDKLGMNDQFKKAGINTNSLGSGLIGMLGPVVLGALMSRALGGRRGGMGGGLLGGLLGGGLGGMLGGGGGLGGLLGGNQRRRSGASGGIGSLISMLSGGRGVRSTGGLFDRILRGM
jgi:uncharacterized tellurite resistance protein B-like protein